MVTLPRIKDGTVPNVSAWTNNPTVITGVTNLSNTPAQTTFTFAGRLRDVNIKQEFKIDYITDANPNGLSFIPTFKYIKSLFYPTPTSQNQNGPCQPLKLNVTRINAPLCQAVNIPVSFSNVKWSTYGEGDDFCWSTITTYEYQLPQGWRLNGGTPSTGNNWLQGSNSVTVTSDLNTGGVIRIRQANNCGSGLANGQVPVQIPINRPQGFTVSPANVPISCGSITPITFTVNNLNNVTGITNHTWNLGAISNGWLYNGSPAPQTISTGTTNTLTLTPVCGATQSNVSASVTVSGTTCNASPSIVTLAAPSMSISGNTALCSGSSVYTLNNVPCNATVTWAPVLPVLSVYRPTAAL